ncbi:MAG: YfhO family protein [Lachnospiraceae bacterium]|nr:YfhO family protein [Lachnospiraceae bacterium]
MNNRSNVRSRTMLILTAMILVTALAVFYQYIFGDRYFIFMESDIGSDTAHQYISQYALLIRKLQTGNLSLWDSTNGFGVNLFTYSLTNPFLMLLYFAGTLVGRPGYLYLIIWLYILEILLTGLAGYLYLSEFSFSEYAKIIAAYMFAFNSYLIIWGQHYHFGAYCFSCVILARALERYIRGRSRWWTVTLAGFFVIWTSAYTGYMIMVFAAVYTVIRLLMTEEFHCGQFLKRGFSIAGFLLLGIGMGAVIMLPFAYDILAVSKRLDSKKTLLQRLFAYGYYKTRYYKTQYSRFFLSTGDGISSMNRYMNYYFAPCLHFSLLFVLFFPQYLTAVPKMDSSRKNRVWHYVVFGIFAVSILMPQAAIIMNGFAYAAWRYYFVYMIYFALISARMTDETLRGNSRGWIYVPILALTAWKLRGFMDVYGSPVKTMAPQIALASGMTVCLMKLGQKEKDRFTSFARAALPVFLIMSIGLEVFATFDSQHIVSEKDNPLSSRGALVKEGDYVQELYRSDVPGAIAWIREQDPQYARIEKMEYFTFSVDGMVQDYRGVSAYNSIMSGRLQDYTDTYWPELRSYDDNHYLFKDGLTNPSQVNLAGVKYVIANRWGNFPAGYKKVYEKGSAAVYQNPDVENIGSFYGVQDVKIHDEDGIEAIEVRFEDRDPSAEIFIDGRTKDSLVEGTVTAAQDGYLYIANPNEIGWKAYLDGQEVPMLLANKAFTVIEVGAGSHTFALRYFCPGVRPGLIISVSSLAVFVFVLFLTRKRKGAAA